jgi:hypothetical protein
MCACKESDVRESPNDGTLAGWEGQGGRGETCYTQYRESPVSSMIESIVYWYLLNLTSTEICQSNYNVFLIIQIGWGVNFQR